MTNLKTFRAGPIWAALLLFLAPAALRGDARSAPTPFAPAVLGTVVDTAGTPLANATIIVAEVARSTTTNDTPGARA